MRIIDYPTPSRALVDSDAVAGWVDGRQVQVPAAAITAQAVDAATAGAASHTVAAQLAAATALAASNYHPTRAAGEAATAVDGLFSTGDGAGNLISYQRTATGSTEIGRAVTPAALASSDGTSRIGWIGGSPQAQMRLLQDKIRDLPVHVRDYVTLYASKAESDQHDQSAQLQAAIDYAASVGAPLDWGQGGWVSAKGLLIRSGMLMRRFTISHLLGADAPLFGMPTGPITGVFWQDGYLSGNGGSREECPWMFHAVDGGNGNGGWWFGGMDNVTTIGFGGSPWLRGGADDSFTKLHQFLTFTRMQCYRPAAAGEAKGARSWRMTGCTGQIFIPRGNIFDNTDANGLPSTGIVADGVGVCISHEYVASDGTAGDYADSLLSPERGWTKAGEGRSGIIEIAATMQGNDRSLLIESAQPIKVHGDFENNRVGLTLGGYANALFVESDLRNSAGTSTSDGTGAVCEILSADVSLLYGTNRISGTYIDRTYVNSSGAQPVAFEQIAPDFSDADLSSIASSVTPAITGSDTGINIGKRSHVLLIGAATYAVDHIVSKHGVGAKVTVFTDYNTSLTLQTRYKNLVTPGTADVTIGPLSGVDLVLTDFRGGTWRPVLH